MAKALGLATVLATNRTQKRSLGDRFGDCINIRDYNASVGNGTNDDAVGLQSAVTDSISEGKPIAIGPPNPGGFWNLASPILAPTGTPSGQNALSIAGYGLRYYDIRWRGGNSASVFKLVGSHNTSFRDIKIYVDQHHDVNVWDLDTAAAAGSTGSLSFYDCEVDAGPGVNNVGWRFGHVSAGGADLSFIDLNNCSFDGEPSGGTAAAGTCGVLVEGANTLNLNVRGGHCYYAAKGYSNVSGAGATNAVGGGNISFHGFGTSHNELDFEQGNNAVMKISAARFEHGKRFLNVPASAGQTIIILDALELGTYDNGASSVMEFGRPGTFILDGCRGTSLTPSGAAFINLGGFSGQGNFHMRGCAWDIAGKCWTNNGLWLEDVSNTAILSGGAAVGYQPNRSTNAQTGTAYTAQLSDTNQVIQANNASANAVTIPPASTTTFPIDGHLEIYNAGAGTCTVTAGSGVTVRGTATLAQYATGIWRQRATDEWVRVS